MSVGININITKVEAVIVSTTVLHNITCHLNKIVSNISIELEKHIRLKNFEQEEIPQDR